MKLTSPIDVLDKLFPVQLLVFHQTQIISIYSIVTVMCVTVAGRQSLLLLPSFNWSVFLELMLIMPGLHKVKFWDLFAGLMPLLFSNLVSKL